MKLDRYQAQSLWCYMQSDHTPPLGAPVACSFVLSLFASLPCPPSGFACTWVFLSPNDPFNLGIGLQNHYCQSPDSSPQLFHSHPSQQSNDNKGKELSRVFCEVALTYTTYKKATLLQSSILYLKKNTQKIQTDVNKSTELIFGFFGGEFEWWGRPWACSDNVVFPLALRKTFVCGKRSLKLFNWVSCQQAFSSLTHSKAFVWPN